jgi:hypothetical protein
MILPKSIPIHQGLPGNQIMKFFQEMRQAASSGYVRLAHGTSLGYYFFESGRLIGAQVDHDDQLLRGPDAIYQTSALSGGGTFSVYKLSKDLAKAFSAFATGRIIHRCIEVANGGGKQLVIQLRESRFDGTVLCYAGGDAAALLYQKGSIIGFGYDNNPVIDTNPSESQRVMGLPGARMDAAESNDIFIDYMQNMTDQPARLSPEKLKELEEGLKKGAYLCMEAVGVAALMRELSNHGGLEKVLVNKQLDEVLKGFEQRLLPLTKPAVVTKAIEVMKLIR